MSIHYKFKNTINYDAVKFDSVYISAADLKTIIIQQKKLGHSELQVMNEETKTVYADHENIPKNTNIIVSRIPFANSNKRARLAANNHHSQDKHGSGSGSGNVTANGGTSGVSGGSGGSMGSSSSSGIGAVGSGGGREAMELVSTKDMSEEEKIKYIQSQSTKDFDPARYARGGGRGRGARGGHHRHFVPPPGYTCRKCGIPGHSIYDCKMSHMTKVKRSTGIPRDFLEKADSKEKGAVLTPSGEYAVHYLDREAYSNPKVEKPPFFEEAPSDITPASQSSTTAVVAAVSTSSEPTSRAKRKHPDDQSSGNNNDY